MSNRSTKLTKRCFTCKDCGKQFNNYSEEEFCTSKLLRKHIDSNHHDHQDFSCEKCGQNFTLKSSLDRHAESKSDVSCEECGKSLCNANSLNSHMKEVHYSECDQCGQKCRQKYLKMHKQHVHKHPIKWFILKI